MSLERCLAQRPVALRGAFAASSIRPAFPQPCRTMVPRLMWTALFLLGVIALSGASPIAYPSPYPAAAPHRYGGYGGGFGGGYGGFGGYGGYGHKPILSISIGGGGFGHGHHHHHHHGHGGYGYYG